MADSGPSRADSLRSLAAEIRGGLSLLDRLVEQAPEAGRRLRAASAGDSLLVAGGGGLLHGFYNQMESVFEAIAGTLNGGQPEGAASHTRLLRLMALDVPGIRPAVVDTPLSIRLREYLTFRHRFRHIYALDLDRGRVCDLLDALPALWAEVRNSLERFATEIERVATRLRS